MSDPTPTAPCAVCNNPWVPVEHAPRENPEACATCGAIRATPAPADPPPPPPEQPPQP